MALSALRSVGDAIDATREFMLPLSVRRWATMALVVLFMGTPGTPVPANPQFLDPTLWRGPEDAVAGQPGLREQLRSEIPFDVLDPGTWPAWLYALLGLLLVLFVAYQLLGVLMRFAMVEALSRDEVRLRRYARWHLGDAVRVFALRSGLWLLATALTAPLLVALAPIGPWTVDGWATGGVGALVAAIGLGAWLVDATTLQFVVPTMVRSETGALAGWRRFWPVLRSAWREYVAYALVRTLLGIGVGIAALVCVVVVLAFGAVLLGTASAAVVLASGGFGSLGSVATATIAAFGLTFVAFAIVVYAAVTVPFQVYLWVYALLVLGDTDGDLDLVPEYRELARSSDDRFAA